jgi:hypothetical protein
MPVRHENHRCVTMPPAVLPGRIHQPLNFGLRQVFSGPQVSVGRPPRHDCSVYDAWSDEFEMRFGHAFGPPSPTDCLDNAPSGAHPRSSGTDDCRALCARMVHVGRGLAVRVNARVPYRATTPGGFSIIEAFKKPLKSPSTVGLFAALSFPEALERTFVKEKTPAQSVWGLIVYHVGITGGGPRRQGRFCPGRRRRSVWKQWLNSIHSR